jgi:hypothetical protein
VEDWLEDNGLLMTSEAPLAASVATVVAAALMHFVVPEDSDANGEYCASFSTVALATLANSVGIMVAKLES